MSLLVLACREEKKVEKIDLIDEIKAIYVDDQRYRSILTILDKDCSSNLAKDGVKTTQSSRDLKEKRLAQTIFLEEVVKPIDSANTEKLINITKKFGYPGMLRLNHDIPIHMVFVHSDESFFEEIRSLVKEEYIKKNISNYEKEYILWHLDGRESSLPRPEFPVNYRKDIDILKKKI